MGYSHQSMFAKVNRKMERPNIAASSRRIRFFIRKVLDETTLGADHFFFLVGLGFSPLV